MNNEITNESLPYYASIDNITKYIDAAKKKSGDFEGIKILFGKGKVGETRKALIQLGIIEKDSSFTSLGNDLIYELDPQKKEKMWFTAIKSYSPYILFLESLITNSKNKNDSVEVTYEEITSFWGKYKMGTNEDNRKNGAPTFGSFIELAGLGKNYAGRKGLVSRIEINISKLNNYLTDAPSHIEDSIRKKEEILSNDVISDEILNEGIIIDNVKKITKSKGLAFNINVDMTEWTIEKIKEFMDIMREYE